MKSIVRKAVYRSGAYKLRRLKNACYIIAYHMIVDNPCGYYPETSSAIFKRQMDYIVRNYRVLPLHDLVERIKNKKPLRRCISITFDDGFMDNYLNAYPVLKSYGLPATIFLTTGYIDSGEAPWFIQFRHMFMKTGLNRLKFKLGSSIINKSMNNTLEKLEASDVIMAHLKVCPDSERIALLEQLRFYLKADDSSGLTGLMLNWDNVREMAENGICFGAHTVTHPVLSRLDPNTAEYEILSSKRRIEEELSGSVTTFAYPFGRKAQYTDRLFPILRRHGFSCAVTTEQGCNNHSACVYELKRGLPWELYVNN